jgi:glycosyltransferase involved in cell wall biosynthesis
MRIAVIAPTQVPARTANSMQVMKMSQALAGLGHTVCLAYPLGEGCSLVLWPDLARHYGLRQPFEVVGLPALPRLRRYDYGLRSLRWARRQGADLVYTRLPQAAAFASLSGLPVIFELHDLPGGGMGPLFFRLFLRGGGARRLVAITRALAADLDQRYRIPPRLVIVAPDGVDLERFTALPEPPEARRLLDLPSLTPAGFTAGYTGHLYAGRGGGLLLEAARRLPQVNFLLVGGEPAEVERIRAEAGGLPNVLLTGFIPNADLPRYQAACDLLLMPYERRVEASSGGDIARYLSPMKAFEYLACGRAILSSDLPVLREVLHPGNAVLLPPGEVEVWVEAITALLDDPERRLALGRQARLEAVQYSWRARAKKII